MPGDTDHTPGVFAGGPWAGAGLVTMAVCVRQIAKIGGPWAGTGVVAPVRVANSMPLKHSASWGFGAGGLALQA